MGAIASSSSVVTDLCRPPTLPSASASEASARSMIDLRDVRAARHHISTAGSNNIYRRRFPRKPHSAHAQPGAPGPSQSPRAPMASQKTARRHVLFADAGFHEQDEELMSTGSEALTMKSCSEERISELELGWSPTANRWTVDDQLDVSMDASTMDSRPSSPSVVYPRCEVPRRHVYADDYELRIDSPSRCNAVHKANHTAWEQQQTPLIREQQQKLDDWCLLAGTDANNLEAHEAALALLEADLLRMALEQDEGLETLQPLSSQLMEISWTEHFASGKENRRPRNPPKLKRAVSVDASSWPLVPRRAAHGGA